MRIIGEPVRETARLAVKLKHITDTYILQPKRTKFNANEISTLCQLCEQEDETREHFLLRCSILDPVRKSVTRLIENIFIENNKSFYDLLEETQMQILLDSSVIIEEFNQKELDSGILDRIETLSRKLIYALHIVRYRTLGIGNKLKNKRV